MPVRLAVYRAMPEGAYALTEQLIRLIEQDEGFFSRVSMRKSSLSLSTTDGGQDSSSPGLKG